MIMSDKKHMKKIGVARRLLITYVLIFLLFLGLGGRLFFIMVNKSAEYKKIATGQWKDEIIVNAKRGRILDRNGNELALSGDVYRVDLDMLTLQQTLKQKNMDEKELITSFSSILNIPADNVSKQLNATGPTGVPLRFITFKRKVQKPEADRIKALSLRGIIISSDTERYYPNNNFLAQVLGFTNVDGKGLSGIELSYDKELSGTPGVRIAEADNKRSELPYNSPDIKKPVDGKDVMLTIDETIQQFAEKAAAQALETNHAKSVTITVMDPNNGEILAMVSKPDFNPNTPYKAANTSDELARLWTNRAVQDAFEPGSIFKVITAAAAMEENVVKEDDKFVCNGSLNVKGRIIYCWEHAGHGVENFIDILRNSCNVGFMEVGKKLGKTKLVAYAKKYKFGQKTGIDLPGESAGIVRSADKINDVELANMSFGQGIAVNAVQYMAAFNAVANGGTWIRPHIMKQVTHLDESGNTIVDKEYTDLNKQSIVSGDTAKTLRGYLEKVVSDGVGINAFIDGYRIGGKTGTAQKITPGKGYEAGKYMSSFAGMAPVDNPKITMLISIDEPDASNYYAGQTAAPAAKQLYSDIFNYLILKGDKGIPNPVPKEESKQPADSSTPLNRKTD